MSGFLGFLHKNVQNPAEGQAAAGAETYVSVTTAQDILVWAPSKPVQIVRWGFIATTTVNDGANALKLRGDFRPTAGSNAGRVNGVTTTVAASSGYNAAGQPALFSDTAGGTLTLTPSATQVVAGQGVYHQVNPQTAGATGVYPAPDTSPGAGAGVDTQLVIYPGQEFVLTIVATAPAAGAGVFFVEARELPNQGDTKYPSAFSPTPSNALFNMVRVNS